MTRSLTVLAGAIDDGGTVVGYDDDAAAIWTPDENGPYLEHVLARGTVVRADGDAAAVWSPPTDD